MKQMFVLFLTHLRYNRNSSRAKDYFLTEKGSPVCFNPVKLILFLNACASGPELQRSQLTYYPTTIFIISGSPDMKLLCNGKSKLHLLIMKVFHVNKFAAGAGQ